jgi:hypothetical protein
MTVSTVSILTRQPILAFPLGDGDAMFRGVPMPAGHVRVLMAREWEARLDLAARMAAKRPLVKFGPVIVGHDGSNAFERSIIVTAARIVADANARRFGPTWFRA